MECMWRSEDVQGHSFFPWCGYQELNSGHLAGPQDPFPLSHLTDLCCNVCPYEDKSRRNIRFLLHFFLQWNKH